MIDQQEPCAVELKPCPFCGSGEVGMSFSATMSSADPAARFVECEACTGSGPSIQIEGGDDWTAKTAASAAWNHRLAGQSSQLESGLASTCDGKEQPAFEEWAKGERFNMSEHPLHYLFLDPETAAARKGWKAGLTYASTAAEATVWPAALTPELSAILGMMCFQLGSIAHLYRDHDGADIPRRAEGEQAFMLHKLVGFWFRHGPDWAKHAQEDLNRLKAVKASALQPSEGEIGA